MCNRADRQPRSKPPNSSPSEKAQLDAEGAEAPGPETLPKGRSATVSLPTSERQARFRLQLSSESLPPGFQWSEQERAWVRHVHIDPTGAAGMREADVQQLSMLCAAFNSRVGAYALRMYVTDAAE